VRSAQIPARHAAVHAHPAPGREPQRKPVAVEVGCFFRDLRYSFRLSQPEAAHHLGTHVDIIAALEAGDVQNLPPWPETCRIVQMYTSYVGLDPRPILRLIELLQTSAGRMPVQPRSYDDDEPEPALRRMLSGARATLQNVWEGRAGQSTKLLFAFSIPVALVVLLTQTTVLEAAVAHLPSPVKRIVQGAQNYVIVQLAPVRDGMRWIDVPDPRTRRGDKLQVQVQAE
jgi:hypothetical protein